MKCSECGQEKSDLTARYSAPDDAGAFRAMADAVRELYLASLLTKDEAREVLFFQ